MNKIKNYLSKFKFNRFKSENKGIKIYLEKEDLTLLIIETGIAEFSPKIKLLISTDRDEEVVIGFNFLFYFYISFRLPYRLHLIFKKSLKKDEYEKEFSIAIHDGSLWWNFWVSEYTIRDVPFYRKGYFNFLDFILGKKNSSKKIIEEEEYIMYNENSEVPVLLQKSLITIKRSRWFTRRYFYWDYSYGYIVLCLNSIERYCRKKGELKFDYQMSGEDYEMLVPKHNTVKLKSGDNVVLSGGFYKKNLKNIDDAYIELVNIVYKDNFKYRKDRYIREEKGLEPEIIEMVNKHSWDLIGETEDLSESSKELNIDS